jgi:glycosyltransferase involved in cell wall biosynthesis
VGRGEPEKGGIAAFLGMLLGSRLAEDHDVELLNLSRPERGGGGELTGANLRRTIEDGRALWRAAAGREVVHVHSALAPTTTLVRAGLLATVARLRGARVVIHAHGGRVPGFLDRRRRRVLARAVLLAAHAVVTVSSGSRDALAGAIGARRVRLITNGVRTDVARAGPAHEPPRVLYVGVLTERKGVLDLLSASESLRRAGVAHELRLVGGTPDEGAGEEARIRAVIGREVKVLGQLRHDETLAAYADADVFCLPSWWEAMPLSVLEAMAAGLPVVASAVGDVADVVEDGRTGIVVPPRDRAALARALGRLAGDVALRHEMGAAGRRRVGDRYDLATTVAAIEDLYHEVLRQRRLG